MRNLLVISKWEKIEVSEAEVAGAPELAQFMAGSALAKYSKLDLAQEFTLFIYLATSAQVTVSDYDGC